MASKKPASKDESSIEDMMKLDNLLDDRIQLANTISVLEDETEDSQYRTSLTEDVLPEANEDLSSGMFNGLRMVDFSIYRLCYFCMLTNLPAIANKVSKVAEGEGGGHSYVYWNFTHEKN